MIDLFCKTWFIFSRGKSVVPRFLGPNLETIWAYMTSNTTVMTGTYKLIYPFSPTDRLLSMRHNRLNKHGSMNRHIMRNRSNFMHTQIRHYKSQINNTQEI
jgi:hypothetical protein